MLQDLTCAQSGEIVRNGARVRYEVFGAGDPKVLLLPTWSIVHTDFWRHQVEHLASHCTVVTFDGLGNGASDRPADPAFYSDEDFARDAANVLEAADMTRAVVVSASMAAAWQLLLASRRPDLVAGSIYIAPDVPLAPLPPGYAEAAAQFDVLLGSHDGWDKWNRRFWGGNWEEFCRFFFSQCFTEPDSEAEIEHFVSMGLETTPEVVAATVDADGITLRDTVESARVARAPSLVIHGDADAISSVSAGKELAAHLGAELALLPGSGHEPHCRAPQIVNALMDTFIERVRPHR